ncbi:quinone oxidoreductase [Pseudonocardia sp. NPDC049635]|uniref:quinone oxidoreductase family protein n=1 Tax=Pseudonocardia sp. NPDC049635 TaxID=3155506 RepID=UPI0033F49AB2
MRAIRVTRTGGPDVLEVADVEPPAPGPGEVLVEIGAAGVNYIDTYQREGIYPIETPYVPGLEGSGRVVALGPDVQGVEVGDRIAWAETLGSYAEQITVPWAKAVPVPETIADDVAVGALLQGMTAHFLVNDCRPLAGGETVLVHAAAGGVGLLLTQLATAKGARVIGTTSSAEKAELARAAGAAEVIDYTRVDDLAAEVRRLSGGAGVDAVFDSVGRTTFDASLASLRKRGTLVLYGAASGPVPPVDPQRLNAGGSLYLTRPKLFDYVDTTEALRARADAVYTEVAAGRLDVRIGHRYPLEDARSAHEDLQARRTTGKIVLLPS